MTTVAGGEGDEPKLIVFKPSSLLSTFTRYAVLGDGQTIGTFVTGGSQTSTMAPPIPDVTVDDSGDVGGG